MGLNDERKRQNRRTYHEIMYEICDLPGPVFTPMFQVDAKSSAFGNNFVAKHGLGSKRKLVGINTGGGNRWQYKKWTLDGYLGFIDGMKEQHPDVGLVLLGGPEEVELNKMITERAAGKLIDSGCHNSLPEFASLINSLDVLLTSDSLAMHIGVALGRPTVALVGPTSPWELDMFGRGDIVHSGIECLACYLSRCDKVVNCMNTLSPEVVTRIVEKYL